MSNAPDNTIKSDDLHSFCSELLLSLVAKEKAPRFTTLFGVLLYAASRNISVHMATQECEDFPSSHTVNSTLYNEFRDIDEIEEVANELLGQLVPKYIRKKKRMRIAIDFHSQPFYGEVTEENRGEIRNGQKKNGTRKSFTYATACIVHKNSRYTLALMRVIAGETAEITLYKLMRKLKSLGISPSLLLLDGEFYKVPVMRYLIRRKTPFIIPATKKGRKPDHKDGPTGLYRFALKKAGWYRYTLNKKRAKKGRHRPLTIDLAVMHVHNNKKKGKESELKLRVYAAYGLKHRSLRWLREMYRTRFGIETSYRQGIQAKIRTTTCKPSLRFLYFFISHFLRQTWVWVHGEIISGKRRGGRRLQLHVLPFQTFLAWIQNFLEEKYKMVRESRIERDFQEALSLLPIKDDIKERIRAESPDSS